MQPNDFPERPFDWYGFLEHLSRKGMEPIPDIPYAFSYGGSVYIFDSDDPLINSSKFLSDVMTQMLLSDVQGLMEHFEGYEHF